MAEQDILEFMKNPIWEETKELLDFFAEEME